MILDDCEYGAIVQRANLVVGVGYDDGTVYAEISNDNGVTKAMFGDGTTRKAISPGDDGEQPTVEILDTGEIIVALTYSGQVRTYLSRDWGEHWVGL